ncbi:MAG TPA: hypothetical protein VGN68_20280 [Sphingopyxis sp.]|nr:hypothetical protein [Sphingopyxis sp.]
MPVGSATDFATGYLRHVLGFVGITDVTVIEAGQQMMDGEAVNRATAAIEELRQAA